MWLLADGHGSAEITSKRLLILVLIVTIINFTKYNGLTFQQLQHHPCKPVASSSHLELLGQGAKGGKGGQFP